MSRPPAAARPARPTIRDVAREAGVSKATVSRYFNHRERLLGPDIAARVETAVAALGYVPSPMAQALSRGRSRLVGLIVADITNPFSVAVLRGAEKTFKDAGYLVMLFNIGNEAGREKEAIDALAGYQVDGFILNTLGRGDGVVDAIAAHGKPAVLVDRRHDGLAADFVSIDNAAAMAAACRHLVAGGWSELLYVTEPQQDVSTRRERSDAFRQCLADCAGAAPMVRGEVFENTEGEDAQLREALRALRRRARAPRRPAVVAGNSVTTLRVARAMGRLGWRFGDALGFVGFDDPEWAPLVGPGLSAIAQPTEELGRTAARCLIERLQGLQAPARERLLPATLVARRVVRSPGVTAPGRSLGRRGGAASIATRGSDGRAGRPSARPPGSRSGGAPRPGGVRPMDRHGSRSPATGSMPSVAPGSGVRLTPP